jgi:hypothetical protein
MCIFEFVCVCVKEKVYECVGEKVYECVSMFVIFVFFIPCDF